MVYKIAMHLFMKATNNPRGSYSLFGCILLRLKKVVMKDVSPHNPKAYKIMELQLERV